MPAVRPRPRYKEQARAALRSFLLREAALSVLRRGCPDVRVEAIAGACGVAKGTAYLQFPSRKKLLGRAVRQLDEALAARLAAPPRAHSGARATLRWTVLEAVDAQIAALAPRPGGEARHDAASWPCCHRLTPCPYGGAARSLSIVERRARAVTAPGSEKARARDIVDLLMAVSIARLLRAPQRPTAVAHRRYIARLFDRLLA